MHFSSTLTALREGDSLYCWQMASLLMQIDHWDMVLEFGARLVLMKLRSYSTTTNQILNFSFVKQEGLKLWGDIVGTALNY